MTINMEVKKDGLQQLQSGSWKLTLTVNAEDMSMEIMQAPMGTPYGLAMVPIQYDDTPPNLDHFTSYKENSNATTKVAEKTEGEKLRTRAVMLCQLLEFHSFLNEERGFDVACESNAAHALYDILSIKTRAELKENVVAQEVFKSLDIQYQEWLTAKRYKENFERIIF